jgi:hypothetical protein
MLPPDNTQALLDAVEQSSNCKLMHRSEVAKLLETTREKKKEHVFEDIIFFAKFLTNAEIILKREGITSEQTQKLTIEFKETLEKTAALLHLLINESPAEVRPAFLSKYLSPTQESMTQLFSLLRDLARVKNYLLDHQRSIQQH